MRTCVALRRTASLFLAMVLGSATIGKFALPRALWRFPKLAQVQDEKDIYRLDGPGGSVRYKTLADYNREATRVNTAVATDSTIFDLRSMTDSAFSKMYTFWQEVDVSTGSFFAPVVGDINKNRRAELYGYQKLYTTPDFSVHGRIFEIDTSEVFKLVYTYPDSVVNPLAQYDIDNDQVTELVMRTWSEETEVFRASGQLYLPISPSFGFNPFAGIATMYDLTFGDFDNDGKIDVVYFIAPSINQTFISEYDRTLDAIDTVYRFNQPDFHAEGFSVGDFDMDGKTDIVEGSIHGDVYVIEAQGVHQYSNVWSGKVETYNAYLHMQTNDIDGNGKPEFWVGGDAYYNGLGITRFTCFESDGEHSYKPVHRIDLIGVFSFFAGNCFARDVDGDGKEELFICIDQHVIILKFVGSPNNHRYEMFYMKMNELTDQNSVYHGATLYDAMGDGRSELFVTMDQVTTGLGRREFTRVYKPAVVDNIDHDGDPKPNEYQLLQNYPNPFNSATTIRFVVPSESGNQRVQLKVYDLLGGQIRNLLDGPQISGEHAVRWDGSSDAGKVVGSGTYIIVMRAGSYTKAIKALLLK